MQKKNAAYSVIITEVLEGWGTEVIAGFWENVFLCYSSQEATVCVRPNRTDGDLDVTVDSHTPQTGGEKAETTRLSGNECKTLKNQPEINPKLQVRASALTGNETQSRTHFSGEQIHTNESLIGTCLLLSYSTTVQFREWVMEQFPH